MHNQLVTPSSFVEPSPQKTKSRARGTKNSPPRNRNSKSTENNMKTPTKPTQRNQPDYILNSGMNTSNGQYQIPNISNPPFPFSEKSLKMLQHGDTDQIPTKEAVSNILELLTRKDNLVKLSEYASSAQQHAPITIDAPLKNAASSSYSYSSAPVTPTKQHVHYNNQQQSEKIVRPLSPPTRDSSSANRPRRNSNNTTNVAQQQQQQPTIVTSDSASPVPRWAGSISAPSPSALPKPVFFTSPAPVKSAPASVELSSSVQQQNTTTTPVKSSAARQLQFGHSSSSMMMMPAPPVVNAAPQAQMMMAPMPFPFPPVAPQQQQLHPTVQQMMAHVAASSTVANHNQDLGQLSNQLKMMLNISPASVRS